MIGALLVHLVSKVEEKKSILQLFVLVSSATSSLSLQQISTPTHEVLAFKHRSVQGKYDDNSRKGLR